VWDVFANQSEKFDSFATHSLLSLSIGKDNVKIVDLLIKNSVDYNIDLNGKDIFGKTGYHYCEGQAKGQVKKLILKNADQFNIDLN
jgi:hypothetical protein